MVGIDVANSISAATRELAPDRLIVDLRGNTGGGMGCLRVMSYLCPDRRGVGHSVTRKRVDKGFDKESLPVFDRIPPDPRSKKHPANVPDVVTAARVANGLG
jgi:C-terminal processing protease CtpA/Prc